IALVSASGRCSACLASMLGSARNGSSSAIVCLRPRTSWRTMPISTCPAWHRHWAILTRHTSSTTSAPLSAAPRLSIYSVEMSHKPGKLSSPPETRPQRVQSAYPRRAASKTGTTMTEMEIGVLEYAQSSHQRDTHQERKPAQTEDRLESPDHKR